MVAQLNRHYLKTRPFKVLPRLISYAFFEGRPVTTKGMWINPLLLAHLNYQKTLPFTKPTKKPIFIVGSGRSGTTLLGVILSLHPDVGFLNEPKVMWHCIYGEEDVIGSYSQGTAKFRLFESDATEQVRHYARRLFSVYLATTRASRLVDKYPELIFRIPFITSIFPDAKFIFIVRNGWDTCMSIENWSGRKGQKTQRNKYDWWGVNDRKWQLMVRELVTIDPDLSGLAEIIYPLKSQADRAAVEWIITMREGLKYLDCCHKFFYVISSQRNLCFPVSFKGYT